MRTDIYYYDQNDGVIIGHFVCDVKIYCLAQSQFTLRTIFRILSITRKFDLPLQ